ncbi:HPr kinase/phosphorylase [Amorphus coralli]|uniref:HPr kinase/phosphorylase n=1 Tax=Amorphus coralli TaxID=340680 RepID=UPI000363EB30|nr:HPr kinase/phosphatase C-terminal domain-containing protein [Amorphus coralli]
METVHATCLLIGRHGVLIRGASGSGKTALAGALIDAAQARGGFACLVADDRVSLAAINGRLVARVPDTIAGLMEIRGRGIERVDHEPAAVVRLVVDMVPQGEVDRLPDDAARITEIEGIRLPLQAVSGHDWPALASVRAALARLADEDAGTVIVDFP